MSWLDRLRNGMRLQSPSGAVFEPLWVGNDRKVSKKLGIFEFPKVRGAVVQDLDVGGDRYPLTLYFEGADNDVESARFFNKCKERGTWVITHPVLGNLRLQLIEITQRILPVESGNVTRCDTQWIEPISDEVAQTLPQLRGDILARLNAVNTASGNQFEANISTETQRQIAAVQTAVQDVINKINDSLAPVFEASSDVNTRVQSVRRGLVDIISSTDKTRNGISSIVGHVQNLVQLPAFVQGTLSTKFAAYESWFTSLLSVLPTITAGTTLAGKPRQTDKNSVSVYELALTSAIGSIGVSSVIDTFDTRPQAIGGADVVSDSFIAVTNGLDAVADEFIANGIDDQYFSQSEAYPDASLIAAQSAKYLLDSSFELAIEKRFNLDRSRSPIEITISEYGTLGENDGNLDLFIKSNGLKNTDILLLPAGREVLVYV